MGRYREEPQKIYLSDVQLQNMAESIAFGLAFVNKQAFTITAEHESWLKKYGAVNYRKLIDMKSEVRTVNKQVRVFTGGEDFENLDELFSNFVFTRFYPDQSAYLNGKKVEKDFYIYEGKQVDDFIKKVNAEIQQLKNKRGERGSSEESI